MDGIGEMLLSEKKETENYENKIQNDILQKGIKKITGKQAKFEARSVPHEDFMEAKLVPIKGYAGLSKAGFADLE